jgi:hypothetical protein
MLISIILSSCYTYKIFPKEYRSFSYTGPKKRANIINPELSKEYEIIKLSGIFELTNDSMDNTVLKIWLHPIKKPFTDNGAIVLTFMTLGQIPTLFGDRYYYDFDDIQNEDTIHKKLELDIAYHVLFWDIFVFHKNFNKKAGQTLLANYYHTD